MEAKLGCQAPKTIQEALSSNQAIITIDDIVNDLKLIPDSQERDIETRQAAFRFVVSRIQLLRPLRKKTNADGLTAEKLALEEEKTWVSEMLSNMEFAGKEWAYQQLKELLADEK